MGVGGVSDEERGSIECDTDRYGFFATIKNVCEKNGRTKRFQTLSGLAGG